MGLARLRDRVGPPVVLLLPALMLTAATPRPFAAAVLTPPPRVDCSSLVPLSAARAALTLSAGSLPTLSLGAQLGPRGELIGRAVTARSSTGSSISMTLPPESFVGAPVGDVIVYTRYTAATGSEVRALNPLTGCDVRLAAPVEIVRSAVLDREAAALYVHSVTKAGRADAGVVRHDLDSGASARAVAALVPPDRLGPIFGTDLRWSINGRSLAVQSCGFSQCLTRVLDVADGKLSVYDKPGQGAFIALTTGHLVTYASCPGLPCAVLSTDLASGAAVELAREAFGVSAVATSTGSARFTIETATGSVEVVQ